MEAGIVWGAIAVLAVLGGWLSYRRARKAGKGSARGCLIAFVVTVAVILVLTAIVTLLQIR